MQPSDCSDQDNEVESVGRLFPTENIKHQRRHKCGDQPTGPSAAYLGHPADVRNPRPRLRDRCHVPSLPAPCCDNAERPGRNIVAINPEVSPVVLLSDYFS
ncbi:hypothetical protein GCM10009772_30340 [Pseudonocardia alni subsp. carboxydivorans]